MLSPRSLSRPVTKPTSLKGIRPVQLQNSTARNYSISPQAIFILDREGSRKAPTGPIKSRSEVNYRYDPQLQFRAQVMTKR